MTAEQLTPKSSATPPLAGRYFTFLLRHVFNGIAVLIGREPIRQIHITAAPAVLAYILGITTVKDSVKFLLGIDDISSSELNSLSSPLIIKAAAC